MPQLAPPSEPRTSLLRWALLCVPAVLLLGSFSGIASNSGYENAWFTALRLPSFMPPSAAFPIAWTFLYICLGLVLAMILQARGARGRATLLALFFVQLAINYAWSPTFFAAHQVEIALGLLAAMILLTLMLILRLWPVRRAAALLLLPYLVWLGFAAALNYQVMVLNPNASELVSGSGRADILLT